MALAIATLVVVTVVVTGLVGREQVKAGWNGLGCYLADRAIRQARREAARRAD